MSIQLAGLARSLDSRQVFGLTPAIVSKAILIQLALPHRCAASLRLAERAFHDLAVYDLRSETMRRRRLCRRVIDLPRIWVA